MPAMRLRANTATLWAASLAAAGRPAPSSLDTLTLAAPVGSLTSVQYFNHRWCLHDSSQGQLYWVLHWTTD